MPQRHPKARSVASSLRRPPPEKHHRSEYMESDDSDGMSGNRRLKQRQYIDPWDLENYIYIKSKLDLSMEEPHLSESPAGEPINSRFYYVPGEYDDCHRCCAGTDEYTFYNERFGFPGEFEEPLNEEYVVYNSYTDGDTSSGEHQNSCDSASTLRLCTPNFGLTRMVMPKPMALHALELPPPPSIPPSTYDCYDYSSDNNNYYSLNDCMDCIATENVPIYATNRSTRSVLDPNEAIYGISERYCSTPYHFGLDKKGLLQIDYSCNWNNLHRYISKEKESNYY